jgi:hypothetical protein
MKKLLIMSFPLLVVLTLSQSTRAQCWSADAGSNSSAASKVRPTAKDPNESILLELEPTFQTFMAVSSRIYMTESDSARAEPSDGNVYFGSKFFSRLENRYTKDPKVAPLLPPDIIQVGIKLILAHEYAHHFQFRMFKKRHITLTAPTPTIELQADILGAYFLGSILDAKYSGLPEAQKVQRVLHESGGGMMVVTELADPYFNDPDHHGNGGSRRAAIDQGFNAGWRHAFGRSGALKEDELYDWSRSAAEAIFKNQQNGGRTF